MATSIDQRCAETEAPMPSPGYLLAPFGWAADQVVRMTMADPSLFRCLFRINQARMHVIALGLAHVGQDPSPDLGPFLVRARLLEILDRVLGRRPIGIRRVLSRLPAAVLARENYQRLVELLNHHESAKLLHHSESIDDGTVAGFYGVPAALRKIVVATTNDCPLKIDGLMDSLKWLVSRGVCTNVDELVGDLAKLSHPAQLIAQLKTLIERLPCPNKCRLPKLARVGA